jgi:hypothetical protein
MLQRVTAPVSSQSIGQAGLLRLNQDDTLSHLPDYNWVAKLNKDEKDFEEFGMQLN